ncbi:MAG: UvrB/UvrC motif-containing protein [Opitutales bacterium]|jgi:protein arginine kinase activator
MAKPEQCSQCNKPATIHLTQILNNKIHKVDLCEDCPYKQGVTDPEGFSLADFLMKDPASIGADPAAQCPTCGFTPADFKKSGRFGCPDCYSAFKEILKPMLTNMHKDTVHRGKVPEKALARMSRRRRLEQYQADLKNAIEAENYEEAARIRDLIAEARESRTIS